MSESCVYFIEAAEAGVVKIGRTRSINSRMTSLQVASPFKLTLVGTIPGGSRLENRLHRRYSQDRTEGEWFNFTARMKNDVRLMLLYREQLPPPSMIPAFIHKDIPVFQYMNKGHQF